MDTGKWWDDWYHKNNICSGNGSRGKLAKDKFLVTKYILDKYNAKSILDVGCGELYFMKDIGIDDYIGIDFSRLVIDEAKKVKPYWSSKLEVADIFNYHPNRKFDIVLLYDILIHQSEKRRFDNMLKIAIKLTNKFVLFTAVGPEREGSHYHSLDMFQNKYKIYTIYKRGKSYLYILDLNNVIDNVKDIKKLVE